MRMTSQIDSAASRGTLLLADISGYTSFLAKVGAAHEAEMAETGAVPAAYPIMTSLLDGIVERLVPPFTLSKTEGDAVFAFAADADFLLRGVAILHCINACYRAFQERVRAMEAATTCGCDACSLGIGLDLKFVLHHGGYVVQSIAGRQELLGPDVNAVHRLLKNHATDVAGDRPYALLTEAAARHLGVPSDTAFRVTEQYEHLAPIEALVFPVPVPE
jgi:Protein of unknown function (DUF2652)